MSLNLLSYIWKRHSSSQSIPSVSSDTSSSAQLPPLVTASTSYGDDDANVVIVPARHPPRTPEGLRPRESMRSIRQQLHVQMPIKEYAVNGSRDDYGAAPGAQMVTTSRPAPSSTASARRYNNLDAANHRHHHQYHHHPTTTNNTALSSSWSLQNTVSSPPVSTSSFYGHQSSDHDVATSPNLVPGQAKTAVGELVAKQQQQQHGYQPAVLDYSKPYRRDTRQQQQKPKETPCAAMSMSILPPPPPPSAYNHYDSTPAYDHHHQQHDDIDDDFFLAPYCPINSAALPVRSQGYPQQQLLHYQPLRTPPRYASTRHCTPKGSPEPSLAEDSVMLPSPSSLAARQQQQQQRQRTLHNNHRHAPRATTNNAAAVLDTSFSSRAKLLEQDEDMYDIEPILPSGTEVILTHDGYLGYQHSNSDPRNMSGMSYSAVDHDTVISRTISDDAESVASCNDEKQRRDREDLFAQVLERLQDDVELVQEVQAMSESATWFSTKTQQADNGLVTGIDKDLQTRIVGNLNALLQQVDEADQQNNDGIPAESQHVLRDSLLFCRQLVYMAVAEKMHKSYQVKEYVRAALGILQPESPEVIRRGGDSSVFSLPPDDQTPMTSNVSLTTTITTQHSPPGHRHISTPGLQLRRTMETVLALVQLLTRVCRRLGHVSKEHLAVDRSESMDFANEFKCAYLQVISLDRHDMKSLVNAFEPQTPLGRSHRNMLRFQARPILPRAPVMTPPRQAPNSGIFHGIIDDEKFEMDLDRRNPFNDGRLVAYEGKRDSVVPMYSSHNENDLNLLAGVCSSITETE